VIWEDFDIFIANFHMVASKLFLFYLLDIRFKFFLSIIILDIDLVNLIFFI
jgi:hypothetical protein